MLIATRYTDAELCSRTGEVGHGEYRISEDNLSLVKYSNEVEEILFCWRRL